MESFEGGVGGGGRGGGGARIYIHMFTGISMYIDMYTHIYI